VQIPGEALPVAEGGLEELAAVRAPSATRGPATTIDRMLAQTSPYGSLRLLAPIILGIGIGLGGLVFLAGLAALIVVSMRGSPLAGVGVFVAGLILAVLMILGAKVGSDLLRLGADVGDRTRQILHSLEDSADRLPPE